MISRNELFQSLVTRYSCTLSLSVERGSHSRLVPLNQCKYELTDEDARRIFGESNLEFWVPIFSQWIPAKLVLT